LALIDDGKRSSPAITCRRCLNSPAYRLSSMIEALNLSSISRVRPDRVAADQTSATRPATSQLLDFDLARSYIVVMTKLLDEAVETVRRLPSADQDDIARAIMQLAGSDLAAPVVLSPDEREAIAGSKAAAERGEFATDEQVRAVWAKHGL
jgi:hypothetical protein